MSKKVCAVLGVGPGNGYSFARKFSKEGYAVALCSRNIQRLRKYSEKLGNTSVFEFDVTDVEAAERVFPEIRDKLGPVDVMIYNAGAGQFANIDDATPEGFQSAWEVNSRGLFLASREVIKHMRETGAGNIVIIGATASWKGGANLVPFASAKGAQRNLAQSLARYLGPDNIHVSYVIVDGVIDIPGTREMMPDKPDDFFMDPDEIAESVYFLTQQKKSAWTFELDLRPYKEKW